VGRVPVPCAGCVACCHTEVEVDDAEPKSNRAHQRTTINTDGKLVLRRTPEGACIHLSGRGCTIYRYRPLACRGYDCRLQGLAGMIERFAMGQESPRWQWNPEPSESLRKLVREVVGGHAESV
jgi:Fe-S-cluster containining protein